MWEWIGQNVDTVIEHGVIGATWSGPFGCRCSILIGAQFNGAHPGFSTALWVSSQGSGAG